MNYVGEIEAFTQTVIDKVAREVQSVFGPIPLYREVYGDDRHIHGAIILISENLAEELIEGTFHVIFKNKNTVTILIDISVFEGVILSEILNKEIKYEDVKDMCGMVEEAILENSEKLQNDFIRLIPVYSGNCIKNG
jgi:hypothetical protein